MDQTLIKTNGMNIYFYYVRKICESFIQKLFLIFYMEPSMQLYGEKMIRELMAEIMNWSVLAVDQFEQIEKLGLRYELWKKLVSDM